MSVLKFRNNETGEWQEIVTIKGDPGAPGQDGAPGRDGIDGKDGADGKDYVLTDADKQEIAGMIDVPGGGGGGGSDWTVTTDAWNGNLYGAKEVLVHCRDSESSNSVITTSYVVLDTCLGDSAYVNFLLPYFDSEEWWYYSGSGIQTSGNFYVDWIAYK